METTSHVLYTATHRLGLIHSQEIQLLRTVVEQAARDGECTVERVVEIWREAEAEHAAEV